MHLVCWRWCPCPWTGVAAPCHSWLCLMSSLTLKPFLQQQALPLLLCCCLQCVFASRSVCNQVPTSNPQLLISPVPPVWPGRNFLCIDSCPSASSHVCNCHRHRFYMYHNVPFICQVNICKSYTHTNEIIIMITNIFFPCFIA